MKAITRSILFGLLIVSSTNLCAMPHYASKCNDHPSENKTEALFLKMIGRIDNVMRPNQTKKEQKLCARLKLTVEEFITSNKTLNESSRTKFTNFFNCSSIFESIILGNINTFNTCIYNQNNVNEKHILFGTPLTAAVIWDRLDFAQRLINCGASADLASGLFLYTPWQIAVVLKKQKFMKLFIKKEANKPERTKF